MPHEKVHRISHATKRSYDEQICKKKEFLKKKRWEYRFCVNRRQKHEIIAELSQTCDYANKYAIRLLSEKAFPLKKKPKPRQRRYTQEDLLWLKRIWSESDFLCGKLLATMIPAVLESFEKDGIAVPASVREHLLKISPASIDRMLKTAKQDRPAKRRGNALNALRKEIPMRPLRASRCPEPGHLGVDTVALGGGSTGGAFCRILTLTDVFSGYTLIAPVWNRTTENTACALKKLLLRLPFSPLEIHPDNGSELINSLVFRSVKETFPRCSLTRSRPYHKNDNAHVEQKNGAFVRNLFGEIRLDNSAALPQIERVCELANLRHNHFIPSRKLLSKTRDPLSGITRSRYEKAATPVERLLSFGGLSERSREVLLGEKAKIHFCEVNRQIREAFRLALFAPQLSVHF